METYIDHCLKQVQKQIENDDLLSNNIDNNNNNNRCHPNDVELVQAIAFANRYSFEGLNDEEHCF